MPRGLGRGLESIIPTDIVDVRYDPTAKKDASGRRVGEQIEQIQPSKISPNPHQPRTSFTKSELDSLADSIKQHGILQPLVATADGSRFQLIAGERRLRAAKQIGLKTVPVIVRSFSEQQKIELALIENLQREDLNLMEKATAYQKLVDEFGMTHSEIGKKLGKDRSSITNIIRLTGLPDDAKKAVAEGRLIEGQARVILMIDPDRQAEFMDMVLKNNWTVRQTEEFARSFKAKGDKEKAFKRIAGIHGEDEVSKELTSALKMKVRAVPTAYGGRLTIDYRNEAELSKLAKIIKKGLGQ